MTDPAYQVLWGTDHLVRTDERVDLDLVSPESFAPGLWPVHTTLPAPFPDPVIFMASFGRATYMHYPRNGQGWPVLSRQMLDVLLQVKSFGHRAIPIQIIGPVIYRADPDPTETFFEERMKTADHGYVIWPDPKAWTLSSRESAPASLTLYFTPCSFCGADHRPSLRSFAPLFSRLGACSGYLFRCKI
ncbi:hypothetical protein IHN32_01705 [Deinococcus sp. 14RED07]|uniref:hypothetical protein n=1 Tax=Deinococcus sp. 14RED07 TaxID=2745874 RepID=UPI001E3ECBE5|nr:hypothetical protein [Deinococcus sp. 14RED07]MCD0174668.1 hypothetical protein [Deinococcus sp. 14RED07]